MPAKSYDKTYSDLSVWVSRDENQGAYLFGVTFGGIDVVIGGRKLGAIDSDLLDAQQAAQAQAAAQPAEPAPADPQTQP